MQNLKFAEILLPLSLEGTFTYYIPDELTGIIKPGFRVLVNFGKRRLYTGIVILIHNEEPDFEPKPIVSVIDDDVFVNSRQIELWKWMADYYCCNAGEILNAAVPTNLIPSSETKFFYIGNKDHKEEFTSSESRIIDLLQNSNEPDIKEIINITGLKNPLKILESLEKRNIISTDQNLKNVYKPLLKNVVVFDKNFIEKNTVSYEKILKQNSKQKEILDYIIDLCTDKNVDNIEIYENKILNDCNASKPSLKSLESKGLLILKQSAESRIFGSSDEIIMSNFDLTFAQEEAYKNISESFLRKKPVLLHGVTSSGKTEIYIKLIEKALSKNKEVLYLLPEIALTSQIVERLKKYFGNKIAVYHSKYSSNVRSEIYKSVLKGELKVVLGTRSSIFLPFNDLGLIIVDEEHEVSYKQIDPDPRYNARDMSIVLSRIHNADVILGSATPSVESYFNAKTGKYSLVELNSRYGDVKLPEILPADIKDAYRRKIMSAHFHPVMIEEVKQALENKEQIILFQNRRGYSPYLECKDCGWVPHCKNCNVSLTYHKFENKLVCHYCGERFDIVKKCGSCNSTSLTTKGFGTERIEDEAAIIFPEARISRLDYDTANSRRRFEKIIRDFEDYKFDILIGTQMVTKGLDFERVRLVGILNADNMMNFPDFRAFERSFQLMMQVSGRAGRRKDQGKVIIQTFNPEHLVIKCVTSNDYISLFNSQIEERKLFRYPPFWNFIVIKLKNKDKDNLYKAAFKLASELKKNLFERVKGPEEPLINKINNLYIINIHIRFEKKISAAKVKETIIHKCKDLKAIREFASVAIEIDVDPM